MPTSITTTGEVIKIFLNRVLRIKSTQPSKSLIGLIAIASSLLTNTCAIHLVLVQTQQHQPQRHSHHAPRSTRKHHSSSHQTSPTITRTSARSSRPHGASSIRPTHKHSSRTEALYIPSPPTPRSHNRSTKWQSPPSQARTARQGSKTTSSSRVSFLLSPRRHREQEIPVHVHTPPRSSYGRQSSKPRGMLRVR